MPLPAELAAALDEHGGTVVEVVRGKSQHPRRTYVVADSPAGRLHAVHGPDPIDLAIVEHEVRVRELVGTNGPLRAPQPLAWGPGWLLGPLLDRAGPAEPEAVRCVVAAAAVLAELPLPPGPWAGRDVPARTVWRRRLSALRAPGALPDLVRAQRILASLELPAVTGHGFFHPVHVFPSEDFVWAIDWELSGPVPAGFDLLNYWTGVREPESRRALFEATVELVGRGHERELRRLRYALAARAALFNLKEGADPAEARRLLALLPTLRP